MKPESLLSKEHYEREFSEQQQISNDFPFYPTAKMPKALSSLDQFLTQGPPNIKEEAWRGTNTGPFLDQKYKTFEPRLPYDLDPETEQNLSKTLIGHDEQIVFVDGVFSSLYSSIEKEYLLLKEDDLNMTSQKNAINMPDDIQSSFVDFNFAFMSPAISLQLRPEVTKKSTHYHLIFVSTQRFAEKMAHPRLHIHVGESGHYLLEESYITSDGYSPSMQNIVSKITLSNNSSLTHINLQNNAQEAFFMKTAHVEVGENATYNHFNITRGGKLSRQNIHIDLKAKKAHTNFYGLTLLDSKQKSDQQTFIHHLVPDTSSDQLVKNVLNDQANSKFTGKIFVHKHAQNTMAAQLSKNLLLSPKANIETKPQLQIDADDVQCRHGATIGQLDEEQMFYLKSRGLSHKLTTKLLIMGFATDFVNKIKSDDIRKKLKTFLDQEVGQNFIEGKTL